MTAASRMAPTRPRHPSCRAARASSPHAAAGPDSPQGLRNLIDAAEEPRRRYTAAVPLQRRAILAERTFMLDLAADVASDDALSPRGIALVERLLTDGASPMYAPGHEGDLHRALIHARAALHLS